MWFDALLHAGGLTQRDVGDLRFFGVGGALVPCEEVVAGGAAAVRKAWGDAAATARRLREAGLAAWAALAIGPRRIPLRGLEALLAELPGELGRPEVAAIGPVGLDAGGELEDRVLVRQLELARELRLPVVVGTPWRSKERITRRVLGILRESDLEPARVLVTGADGRTVRAVRACGYLACLSLSGSDGGAPASLDAAVRLVASLGAEGLVLASDAGLGGGDLLAVPRAADRLAKSGLSDAVVRRACGGNALAFLGLDASAVARG